MVETTIDQVGKGHYLGMKYLFGNDPDCIPRSRRTTRAMQDSLAATLLRRLGIPETPIAEETVTKDSGLSVVAGEDGLE